MSDLLKSDIFKSWKLMLISSLVFSSFAVSASANNTQGSVATSVDNAQVTVATSNVIDVYDIVPKEYFSENAGKFDSLQELKEATGFSSKPASSDESSTFIKVDSIDEYAAVLSYFNDKAQSVTEDSATSTIQTTSVVQPMRSISAQSNYDYYTTTHSKTWNDNGLSWMKAFVTAQYYYSTNKIMGTPTTSSGLYGFHPGNSWTHSVGGSSARVNTARTGGDATITGDLTLFIIIDGIGDILTKPLTVYMTY